MSRVGEVAAGRPLRSGCRARRRRCRGGDRPHDRPHGARRSGELSNILLVADLVAILCPALRNVARDVDRDALVAAIERIESMPSASGGRLTFRPGEHWGCRELREIEWRDGAWRVLSEYRPIDSWLASRRIEYPESADESRRAGRGTVGVTVTKSDEAGVGRRRGCRRD